MIVIDIECLMFSVDMELIDLVIEQIMCLFNGENMFNFCDFKIGIWLIMMMIGVFVLMFVFVGIVLVSLIIISDEVDFIVNNNIKKIELMVDMCMCNLLVGGYV